MNYKKNFSSLLMLSLLALQAFAQSVINEVKVEVPLAKEDKFALESVEATPEGLAVYCFQQRLGSVVATNTGGFGFWNGYKYLPSLRTFNFDNDLKLHNQVIENYHISSVLGKEENRNYDVFDVNKNKIGGNQTDKGFEALLKQYKAAYSLRPAGAVSTLTVNHYMSSFKIEAKEAKYNYDMFSNTYSLQ
jgi:hypothetical protein